MTAPMTTRTVLTLGRPVTIGEAVETAFAVRRPRRPAPLWLTGVMLAVAEFDLVLVLAGLVKLMASGRL